jgi:hypothetical protein
MEMNALSKSFPVFDWSFWPFFAASCCAFW